MKNVKDLLFENWKLKALSLLLAILLWLWVNVSSKVPLLLSKEVQLINSYDYYQYKLQTKKVRLKIYIPQGAKINKIADDIKVYVNVGGLKPGEYVLPIKTNTKFKFLISVEELDPEYTKVIIKEKPQPGH